MQMRRGNSSKLDLESGGKGHKGSPAARQPRRLHGPSGPRQEGCHLGLWLGLPCMLGVEVDHPACASCPTLLCAKA